MTNTRAFSYTATPTASGPGGTLAALYPIASWSTANGVEDTGGIVGQFYMSTCPRAFVYLPGGPFQQLLTLAAGAAMVNGSRYTVGTGKASTDTYLNGTMRATLWKDQGSSMDLQSLAGSDSTKASYADAVNRNGRVVGKAQGSGTSANHRAFRTKPDEVIDSAQDDLGTPIAGSSYSEADGINDFDETVGSCGSYTMLWAGHGAANTAWQRLYTSTSSLSVSASRLSVSTIGGGGIDSSGARAINNQGVIVGWRYSGYYSQNVPVLWWNNTVNYAFDLQSKEQGFYALNTVTIGGGAWNLQWAAALNDNQWIVGWGYLAKNGVTQPHAFLLKPN